MTQLLSSTALPGMELLKDAVDCHAHVCPHINARSINVFEATRQAAAAGMKGLGLMDNFGNSAGFAALAMLELGDLGVDVFGGPILEPCAGGVSPYVVKIALDYGYAPGRGRPFHLAAHPSYAQRRRLRGPQPGLYRGLLSRAAGAVRSRTTPRRCSI